MNRLALLVFTSGLLACGGGTKSDNTMSTANPCDDNPCATANPCGDANPCAAANPCGDANPCGATSVSGVDWSDYKNWTKLSEPFVSKHPGKPWVTVYVQNEHAATYKALAGEMPEGLAVVKVIHSGDVNSDAKMLTGMVKMGSDYDPDNGNWLYAMVSGDGSKIMGEGKLEMCSNCHGSADVDYLFGTKP